MRREYAALRLDVRLAGQKIPDRKPAKDCRFSELSVWGSELDSNCRDGHRFRRRPKLRIRLPRGAELNPRSIPHFAIELGFALSKSFIDRAS